MYCFISENQINHPAHLPNSYKNTVGGFHFLPDELLNKFGFFQYVEPSFNPLTEKLGSLYFDAESNTVKRTIEPVEFDLNLEKTKKIELAKRTANQLISKTDWYLIRKFERDIEVPTDVLNERNRILAKCEEMESEINGLTKIEDIIEYIISFN